MEELEQPQTVWSGRHKNCGWEIKKSKPCIDQYPSWTSYIYITDKEMIDSLWIKDKKNYTWGVVYEPKSILSDLPWNYGHTYYHQVEDNEHRYIKIGDDYQHYWDESRRDCYNENLIFNNLKDIVDELLEKYTETSTRSTRE